MTQPSCFDDVLAAMAALPGPDESAGEAAFGRVGGSLGTLGSAIAWMAEWQGRAVPAMDRARLVLATGSGESAGPVTLRAICSQQDVSLVVLRLPDGGTALSEVACMAAVAAGMVAVRDAGIMALAAAGHDIERAAMGVLTALLGAPPEGWLPVLDETRPPVPETARPSSPLALLAASGSPALAGLAGAILAARQAGVPVLLDGFAPVAAAALLQALDPSGLDHCMAAQAPSPEAQTLLDRLGLVPVVAGLAVPDGEGLAGAFALTLLRAAIAADGAQAGSERTGQENAAPFR